MDSSINFKLFSLTVQQEPSYIDPVLRLEEGGEPREFPRKSI